MTQHGLHRISPMIMPDGTGRDISIFRDAGFKGGNNSTLPGRQAVSHPVFKGPTMQPWIPAHIKRAITPKGIEEGGDGCASPAYRMKGGATVVIFPKVKPVEGAKSA